MFSLIFLKFLLVTILGYGVSYVLCTKVSLEIGLGIGFLITIISVYTILIKPIRKLYKAVKKLDFNLGVIDFTLLDSLDYKKRDELGKIITRFKELSDILAVRIDRVNEETYNSEHDKLSRLYNRTKYEKMKSEYAGHENVCVVYIDVNNLKKMNDIKGHDAGDDLIIKAAEKLEFWEDIGDAYRMGGDEFMVVITDRTEDECEELINDWYEDVGCLNDYESDGFKCMMAYGVAYGDLFCNTDALIKEADEKMYSHKIQIKIANGEDPNSR